MMQQRKEHVAGMAKYAYERSLVMTAQTITIYVFSLWACL